MLEFSYVARAAGGGRVSGVVEAPDRLAAVRKIEEQNCIPIRVDQVLGAVGKAKPKSAPAPAAAAAAATAPRSSAGEPAAASPVAAGSARLGAPDLLLFSEQLAHLLNTGMNLEQALGVLSKRLKRPVLQSIVQGIHQSLTEGRRFSEALRLYPQSFSALYVNLAAAGEASGALSEILQKLVAHLKQMKQLVTGVRQALIYPSVLFCAGLGLVVIFITFMVPQITEFFAKTGGKLPLATRILIAANTFITSTWWVWLAAVAGGFLGVRMLRKTPAGLLSWDRLMLKVPVYGTLIVNQFCAQFARTMATLLSQGVTLLNALKLVEEMSGNEQIRQRLVATRQAVVDGSSLSAAAAQEGLFPELFGDMLAIGERTGQLARTLDNIAEYYEGELQKQVNLITTLLPMLILLLISVVVGLIVFGVLSAVFELTSGLRQNIR